MKVDPYTIEIVEDIEQIIGRSCYNPNSYDGWTGEEGKSFRYPVWYRVRTTKGEYIEKSSKGRISEIRAGDYDQMKYKFGSNHLYVGRAIVEILHYLERRYGLDFEELEKKKIVRK